MFGNRRGNQKQNFYRKRNYSQHQSNLNTKEPIPSTPEQIEKSKKDRIRALLVRIGERSASTLERNLDMLSKALARDLSDLQDFILDTLFQCITHLTVKTSIYGTLTGLLNLHDSNFGRCLIDRLQDMLVDSFQSCDFVKMRVLIRYLAELYNSSTIDKKCFITFIDSLISLVFISNSKNNELDSEIYPEVADFLVYSLMAILIYIKDSLWIEKQKGSDESEANENLDENMSSDDSKVFILNPDFKNFLNKINVYMNIRKNQAYNRELLDIKHASYNQSDTLLNKHETMINLVQNSIKKCNLNFEESGEVSKAIILPQPHTYFMDRFLNLEKAEGESEGQDEDFETVNHNFSVDFDSIREALKSASIKPKICNLLSIYSSKDEEQNSKTFELDRFIAFEYLSDIVFFFEDDRKECIKHMMEIPGEFDKRKIIIETLLSLMLQLPVSQSNLVYYGTIIADLFRQYPKSGFPRLLVTAIDTLFDGLATIDIECRQRLAQQFAYHLSNFDFKQQWNKWSFVTSLSSSHPQRIFCERVINQCRDLAGNTFNSDSTDNHENENKVESDIDEMHKIFGSKSRSPIFRQHDSVDLIPVERSKIEEDGEVNGEENASKKKTIEQIFEFKNTVCHDKKLICARTLLRQIESQASDREIFEYLNEVCEQENDVDGKDKNLLKLDLFLPCFLQAGSISFSHQFKLFDRFKSLLVELIGNREEYHAKVIELVDDFQQNSDLHFCIIMHKFVTYNCIDQQILVQTLTSDKYLRLFQRRPYTEILINLLSRCDQITMVLSKIVAKEQIQLDNLLEQGEETDDIQMKDDDNSQGNVEIQKRKIAQCENRIKQTRESKQTMLKHLIKSLTSAVLRAQVDSEKTHQQSFQINTLYEYLIMFIRKYHNDTRDIFQLKTNGLVDINSILEPLNNYLDDELRTVAYQMFEQRLYSKFQACFEMSLPQQFYGFQFFKN